MKKNGCFCNIDEMEDGATMSDHDLLVSIRTMLYYMNKKCEAHENKINRLCWAVGGMALVVTAFCGESAWKMLMLIPK